MPEFWPAPDHMSRCLRAAAEAIRNGADYLVVGRPVTQASDPRAAAEAVVTEIAGALT